MADFSRGSHPIIGLGLTCLRYLRSLWVPGASGESIDAFFVDEATKAFSGETPPSVSSFVSNLAQQLREAPGRNTAGRYLTLSKDGDERWRSVVVPVLEQAYERHRLGSIPRGMLPYYSALSTDAKQTFKNIITDAYDFGVRSVGEGIQERDLPRLSVVTGALVRSFACEHLAPSIVNGQEDVWVTKKSLETQIETLLKQRFFHDFEEGRGVHVIASFRQGIAAYAVWESVKK